MTSEPSQKRASASRAALCAMALVIALHLERTAAGAAQEAPLASNHTLATSETSPNDTNPLAVPEGRQSVPSTVDKLGLSTATTTMTTTTISPTILSAQASRQQQQTAPTSSRGAPILRASIEEVASELSRKYLNLERHKSSQQPAAVNGAGDTGLSGGGGGGGGAEQEISRLASLVTGGLLPLVVVDQRPGASSASSGEALPRSLEGQQSATGAARRGPNSSASGPPNRANRRSRKRKLSSGRNWLGRLQQAPDDEDELAQCQQYLQLHSTAYQGQPVGLEAAGRFAAAHSASQLLPCSCELNAGHLDAEAGAELDARLVLLQNATAARVWLNCDHVQLIGSQLFTPHFELEQPPGGHHNSSQPPVVGDHDDQHTSNMLQFSQRDADLQVLFAQKFHYLRLSSLRAVDLGRNRLRSIQMDAFHGLEARLEWLNLADNFLGDSRAIDNGAYQKSAGARQEGGGQSILFNDELSRLRALRWLSLRNNQISQLGANVFVRQPATAGGASGAASSSELLYLDLGQNLLRQVPSESLKALDSLVVLKLNDNKITRLDQASKFPSSLKRLDLSNNLIDTICHSDLVALLQLVELDLSHNQLRQLGQLAFTSASALATPAAPIGAQDSASGDFSGQVSVQLIESPLGGASAGVREASGGQEAPRRRKREMAEEPLEGDESPRGLVEPDSGNDLDAVESIFSALTDKLYSSGRSGQTAALAAEEARPASQFNAILKLNLSHNLLDHIPGDSLLRFASLQSLDLSHNRIRKLDSNYLCSIYNLVENLRVLDLSGNLLSLAANQRLANRVQLHKLFGCLQRLEKLLLSTNRLAVNDHGTSGGPEREVEAAEEGKASDEPARLVVMFGDTFGSKNLNTLDLSDNRLDAFPIIEHVVQQPPPLSAAPNSTSADSAASSVDQQAQLNQWIQSRMYLEVLKLNYNNIERLDGYELDHLCNLRQLHLDFNRLSAVPVKFLGRFTSLDQLSLAGNRISSLEPLNELIERSVRTLRVLNLANNRLTSWPKTSSKRLGHQSTDSGSQQQQQQQQADEGSQPWAASMLEFVLEELNLEGNLLTSANVTSLFDQLIHMKALKTLNLNYNSLNKVRSDWFKFANANLRRLQLTGNKINHIDLGAFAANQADELVHLELNFNLLKELKRKTFDSLQRLRDLDLGHNLIHTISGETFHQLNSLRVLRLNHNKLTSWKCEYFSQLCNSISGNINADLATLMLAGQAQPVAAGAASNKQLQAMGAVSALEELDLSHNSLSQLRANSIAVHTKLASLDLSHNKLSFIPHDLFKTTTSVLNGDRQVHLISSLKYLNLASNRIQTLDNINFKPLRNLLALDLSYNELQTLGVDVLNLDPRASQQHEANSAQGRVITSTNLTSLLADPNELASELGSGGQLNQSSRLGRSGLYAAAAGAWPALAKLRALNLAHNSLTLVNQSLLAELSPFAALKLNLSHNYLDSDSLPAGFFAKISTASARDSTTLIGRQQEPAASLGPGGAKPQKAAYDLVFTLKLESLDLSHNRLGEWPSGLLDNHVASMEFCSLAHNRIQNLAPNSNSLVQIRRLDLEFNPLARESSELLLSEQRAARSLSLAATRLHAIQQAAADSDQYSRSLPHHQPGRARLANQTSQLDLIRSISRPIEAPYLRSLNLSSNQLVWLAANVFDRLHSLQELDLSNNQLTRLHLLSSQLTRIAPTLEHLSVSSNLFTSIDATDFNQLSRLRHLNLGNLLSLQKLDCRFLAKLGALRSLQMFNYPQLRRSLNALVATLRQPDLSARHRQKIRAELLGATIGGHCFHLEANGGKLAPSSLPLEAGQPEEEKEEEGMGASLLQATGALESKNWYKIEHLELETFNNFAQLDREPSDGFVLTDELRQLLGPSTSKVSLFGLNLTALSNASLLGVTGAELELKISYTSLSSLPLGQIMAGLAKQTRLQLDLRNNDIQTIDVDSLRWLDELQQSNLAAAAQHLEGPYSSATLRLAANPFRCDCRARPLWLWLNQHWRSVELAQLPESGESGEPSAAEPGDGANYWLKFHAVSQANDLKCFYPRKLRGKLARHVYYNELVCKSGAQNVNVAPAGASQSRRRDEMTGAKSADAYYTSQLADELEEGEAGGPEEEGAEDEEGSGGGGASDGQAEQSPASAVVRVTRFNRYPSAISNAASLYFLANFPSVPFAPDGALSLAGSGGGGGEARQSAIGKRDRNSVPSAPAAAAGPAEPAHLASTRYARHRPNTQQRHAPFDTMSSLHSAQFGRPAGGGAGQGGPMGRSSLLTDSDIMILTVASVAMSLMSLLIISVCLFKHKLDGRHLDQEQILSAHSKLVLSRTLFAAGKPDLSGPASGGHSSAQSGSSAASDSSKRSSAKGSSAKGSRQSSPKRSRKAASQSGRHSTSAKKFATSAGIAKASQQVPPSAVRLAAAGGLAERGGHSLLVPTSSAHNFLLRSPTIRRMHGLASNASDWFRCTLRACPAAGRGARRRQLFLRHGAESGPSQLSTSKLASRYNQQQLQRRQDQYLASSLLAFGCPSHAFSCLEQRVGEPNSLDGCLYCSALAKAMRHAACPREPAANRQPDEEAGGDQSAKSSPNENGAEGGGQSISAGERVPETRAGLTFRATIEQHGGFMPPKMIQALARRLDERHHSARRADESAVGAAPRRSPSETQQQSRRAGGSFCSRDSQGRSMRTFGHNDEPPAGITMSAQSSPRAAAAAGTGAETPAPVPSQIPTIDVDGRFTYQSDSQLDSPYNERTPTETSDRFQGSPNRATPTSTVATGHEDIFVLVRDTPSSIRSPRFSAAPSQLGGAGAGGTRRNSESLAGQEELESSVMQDECSRTSSPIAYGFMRSATALSSSTTATGGQAAAHEEAQSRPPGSFARRAKAEQQRRQQRRQQHKNNLKPAVSSRDPNNNQQQPGRWDNSATSLSEEQQVVVSRL